MLKQIFLLYLFTFSLIINTSEEDTNPYDISYTYHAKSEQMHELIRQFLYNKNLNKDELIGYLQSLNGEKDDIVNSAITATEENEHDRCTTLMNELILRTENNEILHQKMNILLENNYDPNKIYSLSIDENNETHSTLPLSNAIYSGSKECVKILLSFNANLEAQEHAGYSPKDLINLLCNENLHNNDESTPPAPLENYLSIKELSEPYF